MSRAEANKFLAKEKVNPGGAFATLPGMDSSLTTTASAAALCQERRLWLGLKPVELSAMLTLSLLVLAASCLGWWSIAVTEAWGFVTGGICVWLVVREHLWNWPVWLANNVFFYGVFLLMCLIGVRAWWRSWRNAAKPQAKERGWVRPVRRSLGEGGSTSRSTPLAKEPPGDSQSHSLRSAAAGLSDPAALRTNLAAHADSDETQRREGRHS
jgi:hypothetical protein